MKEWLVEVGIFLFMSSSVAVSAPLRAQKTGVTLPAQEAINGWLAGNKVPVVGIGLIENNRSHTDFKTGEYRAVEFGRVTF
jgi:hypothetical protein